MSIRVDVLDSAELDLEVHRFVKARVTDVFDLLPGGATLASSFAAELDFIVSFALFFLCFARKNASYSEEVLGLINQHSPLNTRETIFSRRFQPTSYRKALFCFLSIGVQYLAARLGAVAWSTHTPSRVGLGLRGAAVSGSGQRRSGYVTRLVNTISPALSTVCRGFDDALSIGNTAAHMAFVAGSSYPTVAHWAAGIAPVYAAKGFHRAIDFEVIVRDVLATLLSESWNTLSVPTSVLTRAFSRQTGRSTASASSLPPAGVSLRHCFACGRVPVMELTLEPCRHVRCAVCAVDSTHCGFCGAAVQRTLRTVQGHRFDR